MVACLQESTACEAVCAEGMCQYARISIHKRGASEERLGSWLEPEGRGGREKAVG